MLLVLPILPEVRAAAVQTWIWLVVALMLAAELAAEV